MKLVELARATELFRGVGDAAAEDLSRSLGLLRDRGLLTWRKNVFRIRF